MAEDNKRIVEVNGVRMEVDLREATKVDKFQVGDPIRVLKKKYDDDYRTYYGTIVDFTEFQKQPAIDILYVKSEYNEVDIEFKTITEDVSDIEIAPVGEINVKLNRADVLEKIQNKIEEKQEELKVLKNKKEVFKKHFGEGR